MKNKRITVTDGLLFKLEYDFYFQRLNYVDHVVESQPAGSLLLLSSSSMFELFVDLVLDIIVHNKIRFSLSRSLALKTNKQTVVQKALSLLAFLPLSSLVFLSLSIFYFSPSFATFFPYSFNPNHHIHFLIHHLHPSTRQTHSTH